MSESMALKQQTFLQYRRTANGTISGVKMISEIRNTGEEGGGLMKKKTHR